MSQLTEVDFEEYLIDERPPYEQVEDELDQLHILLRSDQNVIQYGPQGSGKTLSFEVLAHDLGIPLIQFDCSKNTKKSELVASSSIGVDSDGNQFVKSDPGAISRGIMAANEYGSAILVFEEMNALSQNLQKIVNSVAGTRGAVEVPRVGKLAIRDQATLMVGGTMNPSSITGGVFDLNADLRDRFAEMYRGFPQVDKLEDILSENGVPRKIGTESDVPGQISQFTVSLHSHSVTGKVDYEFSTRDALRLASLWEEWFVEIQSADYDIPNESREALRRALRTSVMEKYREDDEKSLVRDEVEEAFTVRIK